MTKKIFIKFFLLSGGILFIYFYGDYIDKNEAVVYLNKNYLNIANEFLKEPHLKSFKILNRYTYNINSIICDFKNKKFYSELILENHQEYINFSLVLKKIKISYKDFQYWKHILKEKNIIALNKHNNFNSVQIFKNDSVIYTYIPSDKKKLIEVYTNYSKDNGRIKIKKYSDNWYKVVIP